MKLCDIEKCTGCMACYNACNHSAINIVIDDEGFSRPIIDKHHCVECGSCVSSCPVLKSDMKSQGVLPFKTYAAWAKDRNLVKNSSSGGVFSLLAKAVISEGGIVCGAALADDMKSVCHIFAEKEDTLERLQGSKYVQSNINDIFRRCRDFLRNGRLVLFSGTPCQVDGLLSYLGKNRYDNLLTVDIVCHGVPSPMIYKRYVEERERLANSKCVFLKIRDKRWSWNRYNFKIDFANATKYYGTWEEDPYYRGFLRELFLRPSCHCCKYSQPLRSSDITLADFWGWSPRERERSNNDAGVSLVLVNTNKGNNIFNLIKDKIYCYEREYKDAVKNQQALRQCFPASPLRNQFWKDYKSMSFFEILNKYCYPEPLPLSRKIKYAVGHFRIYKILTNTFKCVMRIVNKKI